MQQAPGLLLLLLLLLLDAANSSIGSSSSSSSTQRGLARNVTEILNRLLDGYDKNLRPNFGSSASVIGINMNIRSMGPISEKQMLYSFDCYFRQEWSDKRLTFAAHQDLEQLQLNEKMLRQIWKPDTYILNGMGSYLHNITAPNVLFRIKSTGRILYSMRLTIRATCPMDLFKFPMDSQSCPLLIGSHGYTNSDVVYYWNKGKQSIQWSEDLLMSQFDLMRTNISQETRAKGRRGNFSILMCEFEFQRHMGYFLIQLYFPCSLLVVLSWVGFWINREATSDRIELSITTVLTMTFLGTDNRQDLPRVNYGTALDCYVGMCFALIVATIIEFASVHYFTKNCSGELQLILDDSELELEESPKVNKASKSDAADGQAGAEPNGYGDSCGRALLHCIRGSARYRNMKSRSRSRRTINSVSRIDQISKVLFPAVFTIFNVCYWVVYLKVL